MFGKTWLERFLTNKFWFKDNLKLVNQIFFFLEVVQHSWDSWKWFWKKVRTCRRSGPTCRHFTPISRCFMKSYQCLITQAVSILGRIFDSVGVERRRLDGRSRVAFWRLLDVAVAGNGFRRDGVHTWIVGEDRKAETNQLCTNVDVLERVSTVIFMFGIFVQ